MSAASAAPPIAPPAIAPVCLEVEVGLGEAVEEDGDEECRDEEGAEIVDVVGGSVVVEAPVGVGLGVLCSIEDGPVESDVGWEAGLEVKAAEGLMGKIDDDPAEAVTPKELVAPTKEDDPPDPSYALLAEPLQPGGALSLPSKHPSQLQASLEQHPTKEGLEQR